jgi:hypothetical protein
MQAHHTCVQRTGCGGGATSCCCCSGTKVPGCAGWGTSAWLAGAAWAGGCCVYVTRLLAPYVGGAVVAGTATVAGAGAAGAGASGTRLKASSISALVSPFFSRNERLAETGDPRTCARCPHQHVPVQARLQVHGDQVRVRRLHSLHQLECFYTQQKRPCYQN